MNKYVLLIIVAFISVSVQAGERHWGSELDAFPYLTGGYYTSLWYGSNLYHIRAVAAHSNVPDFVVADGFEDQTTDAYALIVDRFLAPEKEGKGWWIGTGFEYWRVGLTNADNQATKHFGQTVYTLGGGYVFHLYKKLTLNPWVAGHVFLHSDTPYIGGKKPDITPVLGEGSLKLGIQL